MATRKSMWLITNMFQLFLVELFWTILPNLDKHQCIRMEEWLRQ